MKDARGSRKAPAGCVAYALAELPCRLRFIERERARASRPESCEAYFHHVLAEACCGVILAQGDGRVLFVNAAGRAMLKEWAAPTDEMERIEALPTPYGVVFGEALRQTRRRLELAPPQTVAEDMVDLTITPLRTQDVAAGSRFVSRALALKDGRVVALFAPGEDAGRLAARKGEACAFGGSRNARRVRELEEANAAKRVFLANMSHELRTPLNGVLGMADILRESELDAEQRLCLDAIRRSGHELLRIVNNLLELSKAEAGRLALKPRVMDLRATLDPLMELLRRRAVAKGLVFQVHYDERLVSRVCADPERLKQIVFNLGDNALKFTAAGRVDVWLRLATPHELAETRTLATTEDAGIPGASTIPLVVEVADTGCGIPPDKRDHVFESFSLGEDILTKKHAGAGLGLPVAERVAALMGGRIWFESKVGHGSRFAALAPLSPLSPLSTASPVCPMAASPKTDSAGNRAPDVAATQQPGLFHAVPPKQPLADIAALGLGELRVLLVEDEDVSRMYARIMLEKMGCCVTTAMHGREALAQLAGNDFDIVLMDIQMPEMDGLAAVQALRQGGEPESPAVRDPAVPVVALTVFAHDDDQGRIREAGVDECVSKPVEPLRLAHAIRDALVKRGRVT